MKQNKLLMAALTMSGTLSAQAQQSVQLEKPSGEDIPAMIISLEKDALASSDPMAFVELSDADVVYFDPSLEKKIEGLDQLRAHYENMHLPPSDRSEMIRPVVQVIQNVAVLTFNLNCFTGEDVIKWNCTEVYRRNTGNEWRIIQTHWSYVKPLE